MHLFVWIIDGVSVLSLSYIRYMIFYEERTGYVENCMFIVKFYFDDNSFLSKTAVILIAGRIASGTTIPLSI